MSKFFVVGIMVYQRLVATCPVIVEHSARGKVDELGTTSNERIRVSSG